MLSPLGDSAIMVRFGLVLDDGANRDAIRFAQAVSADPVSGVVEVVPSLVSVLVRYDARAISFDRLRGELTLRIGRQPDEERCSLWTMDIDFGGEAGPDLNEAAESLGMNSAAFIARHNREPLRVLTTGFAPGFVYCGFHGEDMVLPRRQTVRASVPAGSILFAAGQTAVTATDLPTGWHVIGSTDFRNFDASREPPTQLRAGDRVQFRTVR
ncbi:MAG: carboxyltransferase domain-containing protein [Devosia sp.]|uniref:5-oxoprolinase subunit B family protein n=1 Tax=Devosia sp. TaxID=1871048 RepID=UPI0024C85CA0|nr:carboxyltransferase domain-containing protein [Devosia sp.]UYO00127.1 MAG: carboxyltransferase domain-containing protein [Devosia sp.]